MTTRRKDNPTKPQRREKRTPLQPLAPLVLDPIEALEERITHTAIYRGSPRAKWELSVYTAYALCQIARELRLMRADKASEPNKL